MPVPYSARESHMTWLESAIVEKDWKKVDVLVQQIFLREHSQGVAEKKKKQDSRRQQVTVPATSPAVYEAETSSVGTAVPIQELNSTAPVATNNWQQDLASDGNDIQIASSTGTGNQQSSQSKWAAYVDDAGNTFYFNEQTGETSWTDSSLEMATETVSDGGGGNTASGWQIAFDSDGNAYYYNVATGETSWTDPSTASTSNEMYY